jgi:hypothetical protein
MKARSGMSLRNALPLPAFVLHPLTALVIACVHVYLAAEHLSKLIGGDVQSTHIWKGFGALAGAYVFAALASRRLAQHKGKRLVSDDVMRSTVEAYK